ncbi:MAG: M48 family metalloprotease [Burkholderiaceae bacterium]
MDFHAHQRDARARTRWLVLLMVAAVILVVVAFNGLGALGWRLATGGESLPAYFYGTNTAVILLYVLGGGWLEWQRLAAGGAAIMLRLGARHPDPYSRRERQLVNVAEEMAISSGTPVPELFVLDHQSINAMVAGHDPAHSALLVTRGALEHLSRDELQGVVAHEFAHLLNGDAALNTRLTGALYGLCSLHMLGRGMLRLGAPGMSRARSGPGLLAPLLLGFGALLVVIGWIGSQAARLVQAAVSRQREYLADAQAVQYTRDRDGLGRALRKIAGQRVTPMRGDYAEVLAHFWLVRGDAGGLFDTHPPLAARVRRIYGWALPAITPQHEALNGLAERVDTELPALAFPADAGLRQFAATDDPGPASAGGRGVIGSDTEDSGRVVARFELDDGRPSPAAVLIAAARDPQPKLSRAALLLNTLVAGPAVLGEDEQTSDIALQLALNWLGSPAGQWIRVPLIELLSARLRHWPLEFRRTLVRYCRDAVLADGRVEKIEWIYFTLVRHRLLHEPPARAAAIQPLEKSTALAHVFSMAGQIGDVSARRLHEALVEASLALGIARPAQTPEEFEFGSVDHALDVLRALPALRKPALLLALERIGRHPVTPLYKAFTTAVAAAIDCPPVRAGALYQNGAGQPRDAQTVS